MQWPHSSHWSHIPTFDHDGCARLHEGGSLARNDSATASSMGSWVEGPSVEPPLPAPSVPVARDCGDCPDRIDCAVWSGGWLVSRRPSGAWEVRGAYCAATCVSRGCPVWTCPWVLMGICLGCATAYLG